MVITEDYEIDKFFLSKINLQDKRQLHHLSIQITNEYIECLSEYLDLDVRDTHHLAKEMTYHSVCIFLDTAYRINNANPRQVITGNSYRNNINNFFTTSVQNMSFTNSRVLRIKIANLISSSSGKLNLFGESCNEPELIKLQDISLKPSLTETLFRFYFNLRYRSISLIVNYVKVSMAFVKNCLSINELRVGYLRIQKKYFFQLLGIKLIKLDFDIEKYTNNITIDNRIELYNYLKKYFSKSLRKIDFNIFDNLYLRKNNDFIDALLAVIVIKSEPLLCDPDKLNKAIFDCKKKINKNKLSLLFSVGNWFRFNNAIIAAAGRKLKLPVVEYQNGGRPIYNIGEGFDWGAGKYERGKHLDYFMLWGSEKLKHNSFPKFINVTNPYLYDIYNQYKTKRKIFRRKSYIQFSSIGLSTLYVNELSDGVTPPDMSKHREWVSELFYRLDNCSIGNDILLFIKIKGFGYTLLRGYEWLLFQKLSCKRIKVKYLIKSGSVEYLSYMDLHIFDGPATTFIESIAYNIPSICIWNTEIYEVKDEHKELFSSLREVGIICINHKEFVDNAKKFILNKDYWLSSEVQIARNNFLKDMAFFSDDWKGDLQRAFSLIKDDEIGVNG